MKRSQTLLYQERRRRMCGPAWCNNTRRWLVTSCWCVMLVVVIVIVVATEWYGNLGIKLSLKGKKGIKKTEKPHLQPKNCRRHSWAIIHVHPSAISSLAFIRPFPLGQQPKTRQTTCFWSIPSTIQISAVGGLAVCWIGHPLVVEGGPRGGTAVHHTVAKSHMCNMCDMQQRQNCKAKIFKIENKKI